MATTAGALLVLVLLLPPLAIPPPCPCSSSSSSRHLRSHAPYLRESASAPPRRASPRSKAACAAAKFPSAKAASLSFVVGGVGLCRCVAQGEKEGSRMHACMHMSIDSISPYPLR